MCVSQRSPKRRISGRSFEEHSENDSEASSVCSERSFDAYRRNDVSQLIFLGFFQFQYKQKKILVFKSISAFNFFFSNIFPFLNSFRIHFSFLIFFSNIFPLVFKYVFHSFQFGSVLHVQTLYVAKNITASQIL